MGPPCEAKIDLNKVTRSRNVLFPSPQIWKTKIHNSNNSYQNIRGAGATEYGNSEGVKLRSMSKARTISDLGASEERRG